MAGKSRPMSQIKQLIRLHRDKYPIKTIARHLSISKNTVKSYLKKVTDLNLSLERILELEDPVLERMVRSGNPAYRDDRFEYLKERLPYYEKELSRIGVNRKLLWEEYLVAHPQGYSYAQFCFHLKQLRVSRRDGIMVLEHEPGDKLFIDFSGKKLGYIDHETGEIISCEIFVACLPYSNYCFAIAVPSQRSPDFLYALDCCLQFLGGVPRAIVPDNLKSAVIRTDRYEPEINRSMEDLANHYDTVVVPARPARPRDKSAVENHVKIIYTQVFARLRNRQFFDLPSLNLAIGECIERLNQTRMQDRNYCRQERFLSNELSSLRPLPRDRFSMKYYTSLKVGTNGHVHLKRDRHSYSVPYVHIGKQALVVYTERLVHIYVENTQVALHSRSLVPNKYSTHPDHLASKHQRYGTRSPDYYIKRALDIHPDFHLLVVRVFGQRDRYPEQLYRTCEGLFRLQRSYGDIFFKACEIALRNDMLSYKFLQRILENGMAEQKQEGTDNRQLPKHENIRGASYYS